MTTFNDLGLMPELLSALDTEGYTTPTPIQAQAIPILLAGRDLLGIAQTGTGKTAAFALPILQRLANDRRPTPRRGTRVLVLSPTRELASQIAESFKTYGRHLGFATAVVFGGVAYRPQSQMLSRGLDILVATPGRLLDHMSEGALSLASTEVLVLDEADQMLDLGFIQPLRRIFRQLPAGRQNLFFSATMPREIGQLAAELLHDPLKVEVTPVAKTADRVQQKVLFIEAPKKRALLVELMADPQMSRTLVFTRTKRGADRVAQHLEGAGISVASIHGNKSQRQREIALENFKKSRIRALVATDIAARGIDIDLVSHVINYELPNVPEAYVHRIGRTARAGAEGIAISLVDGEERAYLKDIERLTKQSIPSEDRRNDPTLIAPPRREGRSGGDGDRDTRAERPEGGRRFGRGERSGGGGRPHHDRSGGHQRSDRPHGERRDRDGAAGADRPHRGDRPQRGGTEGALRAHGRTPHGERAQGEAGRGERTGAGRPWQNRQGEGRSTEGRSTEGRGAPRGDRRPDRHGDGDRRPAARTEGHRDGGRPAGRQDHPRHAAGEPRGWPFSDGPQVGRPDGHGNKPRQGGDDTRSARGPQAGDRRGSGKPGFGDRNRSGDFKRPDRAPGHGRGPDRGGDGQNRGPRKASGGGFRTGGGPRRRHED